MSVKQDMERIKEQIEGLPPDDKAYLQSLIPSIMQHAPRLSSIIERFDGLGMMLIGNMASLASESGRERIAKAAKEVFGDETQV